MFTQWANFREGTMTPLTFAQILGRWLVHVGRRTDLSEVTKVAYARLGTHLQRWAGTRCGCHVDLAPYVEHRRSIGISPRTLELELRIAGLAWNWASTAGLLSASSRIHIPKVHVDRAAFAANHRTPTPEEVAKVLGHMPDDDWRLALFVLARTGARVGEVVSLRRRDLDEGGGILRFGAYGGASKTGVRWFPMDNHTWKALAGRAEGDEDDMLFDFGGFRAPIQALGRRIRDACLAADVEHFSPHGLRRMVVSRLLRAGVDVGTAATLTGHSVEVMLSFYQQVTDEDRRAAVEQAQLGVLA